MTANAWRANSSILPVERLAGKMGHSRTCLCRRGLNVNLTRGGDGLRFPAAGSGERQSQASVGESSQRHLGPDPGWRVAVRAYHCS